MRKYFIHTVLGVLLLSVVGMSLLMSPIVAQKIDATVKIKPETLNLKGHGVITVFITEFSDPLYNVSNIDCATINLHVEGGGGFVVPIRCFIDDGVFVAKFDGSSVAGLILTTLGHMQPTPPPKAEYPKSIVVKGTVNGVDFEGSDQIRIILP